jgi:hypothetical protein
MHEREYKSEVQYAIWIGTGAICFGMGIYGAASSADVGPFFLAAMIIAGVISLTYMLLPILTARRVETPTAEKSKRGGDDRIATLLALMDDDERQAFKEALKQRMLDSLAQPATDGELPYDSDTLENLLQEQPSRRSLS